MAASNSILFWNEIALEANRISYTIGKSVIQVRGLRSLSVLLYMTYAFVSATVEAIGNKSYE